MTLGGRGGPSTCQEVLWVLNERLLRGRVAPVEVTRQGNIVEDGHVDCVARDPEEVECRVFFFFDEDVEDRGDLCQREVKQTQHLGIFQVSNFSRRNGWTFSFLASLLRLFANWNP